MDQSSQHRDGPFQIRFGSAIPFLVDCIANTQDIVYRSTFECRAPSEFEEVAVVAEALFAVALGDVQWNRLGRPEPLVTRRSIDSRQSFGDLVREGNLFDQQAIDILSIVVESWLVHRSPFEYEYEYEYRCTEYEYDCPDDKGNWLN